MLSDPFNQKFDKLVSGYNSVSLVWVFFCGLWPLFVGLRVVCAILSKFPFRCLAINDLVAFFIALEACATEFPLLIGVVSGGAAILASVCA